MKSYAEPIQVCAEKNRPTSLLWRNKTHRVIDLHDFWVLQTRWWEREEKRCYYLLSTTAGDMEVFRRDDQWVISRLLD